MACKIKLNKEDLRYVAGETLSGTVEINNTETIKVRSIYIEVCGSADVHWTERESYRSNNQTKSRSVTYSSHEQYLNSQTVLFGTIEGETIEFPEGLHIYTFQCILPDRLPGNVEGDFGKIAYKVKLTIDIPWGFDITEKVHFNVVNYVDLNYDQSLRVPAQLEEIKKFCVCCCGPDKATVTVSIPKTGFAPYDKIHITCKIDNTTKIDFVGVKFKLVQIVSFKATSPRHKTREMEKKILEESQDLDPLTVRENKTEVSQILEVPVCPVSCYFSFNIQTQYVVRVTVEVSGAHFNINLNIPVMIGTVPLSEFAPPLNNITMPPLAPLIIPSAPAIEEPQNTSINDLPSYDEATKAVESTSAQKRPSPIGWNVQS